MPTQKLIKNFGHNVSFKPSHIYTPSDRDELVTVLNEHKSGKIRVVASKHSWSDLIKTDDVIINMGRFNYVEVHGEGDETHVVVGAGCQVKRLLKELNRKGLTLPSVGLIAEQTIAGATATGTHGSGKHSLSHYIQSARIACFDQSGESAQIVDIAEGDELRAARCSLGALGVVVEVTLPVIPQYYVEEKATFCGSIDEALVLEKSAPLQQFFLVPHSWNFLAQERRASPDNRRKGGAFLYRIYWFLSIDLGLHLGLKLFVSVFRSRGLTRFFFRSIVPTFIFAKWRVTDRSDRALVMKHELFRHLELEAFVTRSRVVEAAAFVKDILQYSDDKNHQLSDSTVALIQRAGLEQPLSDIAGQFTHHYPVCFRRIMPDDTLISMASGGSEDWYAISFITFLQPRDDFFALATFLSNSMSELFGARIHWGKWFPQTREQVNKLYPNIDAFNSIREKHDPNGVFQNDFIKDKLGPNS